MPHRISVTSAGTNLRLLRSLLDQYISKPNDNPVLEHRMAHMQGTLEIHGRGLLAWHQHFLAELENWLVVNGGAMFVPLPFWDPTDNIPPDLDNGNTNINQQLPASLADGNLGNIQSYLALNTAILPYHNDVHNRLGGNMPDPHSSPMDPIFWPFHAFLVGVFERWRNL